MPLVHLKTAQISKYIFFENADLKKIHNENIVFQTSLTISTNNLIKFIEDILFDYKNHIKDPKFQAQEEPPDFHGDTLSNGKPLKLKEEFFKETIVKNFTIGGHKLCLMSELPKNDGPDTGKIYLEANSGQLIYVVMDKDNNKIEGTLDFCIPKSGLTKEFLDSEKHNILKKISEKCHTTINTYTFYGIGIDIHTGDIFTRMKDKETGEETVPITKPNPRDYNGNIKDNGNIEVKYICPDQDEPSNEKKSSTIKLNFHIEINEEYEYKSSKDDFTKQLKEMFGNEKNSFIKKHENYIIELINMSILNFKSISNKPAALNLKKPVLQISHANLNKFTTVIRDKTIKEFFIGSNVYKLKLSDIKVSGNEYIELKYLRSPLIPNDLIYQPIKGDGNCLYKAVALYCGKDHKDLHTTKVKGKSTNNDSEIKRLITIVGRPIIIVDSNNGKISNLSYLERDDKLLLKGEPIFLWYIKESEHYDVLILRNPNISGIDIFSKLRQNEEAPSLGIPSSTKVEEITIQFEIKIDNTLSRPDILIKKLSNQINIKLKELDDPQIFRVAIDSVDTILRSYKELRTHEEMLETKKIEMLKFFKEKMKRTNDTPPLAYKFNEETITEEQIIKEFSSCRIL